MCSGDLEVNIVSSGDLEVRLRCQDSELWELRGYTQRSNLTFTSKHSSVDILPLFLKLTGLKDKPSEH